MSRKAGHSKLIGKPLDDDGAIEFNNQYVVDGIPMKPGYYWAKWRIPSEGTFEASELCPSDNWEMVQVNPNHANWENNPSEDEAMSVSVPGVRETQRRDCFVWGDFVSPLQPLTK